MSYTYTWSDAEKTSLKREDADGNVAWVPVTEPPVAMNRDYAEFVSSGATAAAYVAPPAPPEPTTVDKIKALGLTKAELKAFLK